MVKPDSARPRALDPDVQRFVEAVLQAYRDHPKPATLAERRVLADALRKPWSAGGPTMAQTRDAMASSSRGDVRVRIFDPGNAANGALIYLHGGGWTIFSLDSHDRLMREYASRAGVVVIGVDYALSPEAKFPVALEQTVGVVRWLKREGGALGIDAARIGIGGDSAGGNLALATALALRDAGEADALKAVIVNYGAVDDEIAAVAHALYGGAGNMLESAEMADFWANYLGPGDRAHPCARPLTADLRSLPPVFVAIAECDLLAEQNERLAGALRSAGVPVEARLYEGAAHSFLEAMSISPLAERAIEDAALWLKTTLGAVAPESATGAKMAQSRA
jgi:acetyl esterase